MSTESTFPALPVRQRGTLEIIDTAMKLYRRYFGTLMGWSALTALIFVVAFLPTCGIAALLVYPLIPGAGCCAIAAAVRGQRIGFGQVWDFTKPRFGALLGITILSVLLMSMASGVASMVFTIISVAGAAFFAAINSPEEVTLVVAVIGIIIGTVISSVFSVMAYAWLGLIPIIACLEDDKRSAAALGRAWELMKGSWGRVLGLSTLLSIAVVAVMGIVVGSIALLGGSMDALIDDSDTAVLGMLLTSGGIFGLFFLFWNPIQTLILAVLYLDLRVRKEALDLEWSSYASALPAQTNAPDPAAALAVDPAALQASSLQAAPMPSPASMSSYAPGSSAPAAGTAPETRPLAPLEQAATAAPSPAEQAPVSLTKAETSSFSSAPASLAPPIDAGAPAPAPVPAPVPVPASETFDFSSSFSAGRGEDNPFSPGGEPEESGAGEPAREEKTVSPD